MKQHTLRTLYTYLFSINSYGTSESSGAPPNGRGPMNVYATNAKFSFFRGNIEPVFPNYPVAVAKKATYYFIMDVLLSKNNILPCTCM